MVAELTDDERAERLAHLAAHAAEARQRLGRRKLEPDEKAALLARLRAKADALDAEEAAWAERRRGAKDSHLSRIGTPDRAWHDVGLEELDEDQADDFDGPGMAALRELFVQLERRRPAWMADALCIEYPDLPWFPSKGESTAECKAVCARCMVAEECKRYACEVDAQAGIWSGVTARNLKRGQAAA